MKALGFVNLDDDKDFVIPSLPPAPSGGITANVIAEWTNFSSEPPTLAPIELIGDTLFTQNIFSFVELANNITTADFTIGKTAEALEAYYLYIIVSDESTMFETIVADIQANYLMYLGVDYVGGTVGYQGFFAGAEARIDEVDVPILQSNNPLTLSNPVSVVIDFNPATRILTVSIDGTEVSADFSVADDIFLTGWTMWVAFLNFSSPSDNLTVAPVTLAP